MELKAIIVILILINSFWLIRYFPKATDIGPPKIRFWLTVLIFIILFIFGLYLNDNPIYI